MNIVSLPIFNQTALSLIQQTHSSVENLRLLNETIRINEIFHHLLPMLSREEAPPIILELFLEEMVINKFITSQFILNCINPYQLFVNKDLFTRYYQIIDTNITSILLRLAADRINSISHSISIPSPSNSISSGSNTSFVTSQINASTNSENNQDVDAGEKIDFLI